MNFQGFSPDSFEQFIRALTLKIIGPGMTIFGNGPDGGREATFQGKVNYPHPPGNSWDGYGVIQAKFKEKPEGTQKDQDWAARQLKNELDIWETSKKRVPKPEYFIYCTNVELSSASNGGRAAVEKTLEDRKTSLGLKEYAVWDANQLVAYIDGYSEIRQRFSCFLTPGDLLAEFAKVLSANVSNSDAILTAYLCKEILADEDARLSQAGDRSEDRIKLASVFMDLPAAGVLATEPPDESSENPLPPASMHYLLRAAAHKLDPLALYEHGISSKANGGIGRSRHQYGRFVFLGGPGSGKSTIGQFFAQIHRAAILDRRPPHRLDYKVRASIRDIKVRCEEEGMTWPSTPRYPFRIELNAFAKALAAGPVDGAVTLSTYLRQNLSPDVSLTHNDLRDWLQTYPWVLILDGLDEVPSSSNRREVVNAIQNFINEARDIEADLMIVASSRPDGYAGEFDGDEVAQRYLLPLSKPRALACAQRYVNAKTATKGDQRFVEAMATLTSAIDNPLVARLMRSPLQVTFMVTVVSASGKPSDSRWQLYNDYYRTIYERELHKAVPPFDKALNERRQDIDALHHQVGFILQCRAESSGGTQADMSASEFDHMVTACLEENGLAPDDLARQKDLILGAANQRLVFLTSRTPGRLSFDVRSLQEYMAAACMTNGDSGEIIKRMDSIAHSAYWRNTFLFAVGRFFVEPQLRAHRDKIRVLCDDLNRLDLDRSAIKLGSRLALEILESGTIGNVPLFSRNLADCALNLLENPPGCDDTILRRIANVYESSMEVEYKKAIALWLGQQDLNLALSAWMLVLDLEKKGIEWATQMAAGSWPVESNNALVILSIWLSDFSENFNQHRFKEIDELDMNRLMKLIPRVSIEELSYVLTLFMSNNQTVNNSPWFTPLLHWFSSDSRCNVKLFVEQHVFSGISMGLTAIPAEQAAEYFRAIKTLRKEEDLNPDWDILVRLADFYMDPNAASLADFLEFMANCYLPVDWNLWSQRVPWPVACFLSSASSKRDLLLMVEKVRGGQFEDVKTWRATENRWSEAGITIEEFCEPLFHVSPSFACSFSSLTFTRGRAQIADEEVVAHTLFNYLREASQQEVKNSLALVLSFHNSVSGILHCFAPLLLEEHLIPARKDWSVNDLVDKHVSLQSDSAWIDFYNHYGEMEGLKCSLVLWGNNEVPLESFLQAFVDDSSRLGLLRLAGFWCAAGMQAETKVQALMLLDDFDDPRYLLSAMLVRMSQRDLTFGEAGEIAKHISIVTVADGEPNSLNILLHCIECHAKDIPVLEVVLKELFSTIPSKEWQLRGRAEVLRNSFLQAHSSGFDNKNLVSYGLPLIEMR